jgi:hypothetical protein
VRLPRLPNARRRQRYVGTHRAAARPAQTEAEPHPAELHSAEPGPVEPAPVPQVVLCFRDGSAAALDPNAPVARALHAAANHMRARTP